MVGAALVSGQGNTVTIIYGAEVLRGRSIERGMADLPSEQGLGPNPYRGLDAFDETSAAFFFGREALAGSLLDRVVELMAPAPAAGGRVRLLATMGPSGSGKSSVARAGLVPALVRTTAPWLRAAEVVVLRPGASPVDALAAALARLATGDPASIEKQGEIARELRAEAGRKRFDVLSRFAAMWRGAGPLVVLVDQFEETYTLCRPVDPADEGQITAKRDERDAFIHTLLHAASEPGGRVCVVLTLRSDFYGALAEHPTLSKVVAGSHEIVPAMDRDDLYRAVAEPARAAGRSLDPGLVGRVLDGVEAGGGAAALPLVQYALFQIWEGMRDGENPAETLTKLGGIGGALAGRADRILEAMPSERERALAQRVFLATVQPGEGSRDTRRRAWLDEAVPAGITVAEAQHALQPFVDERLLVMGAAAAGEAEVDGRVWLELPHEALIRHWHTLRVWVDAQRDSLKFSRRLQEASERWHRREGDLWQGIDLQGLEQHARLHPLTVDQVNFLVASKRAAGKRRRREWALVAVLALSAIGSAAASLYIYDQRTQALAQRDAARIAQSRSIAKQAMGMVSGSPENAYFVAAQGVPWPGMGRDGEWPEVVESRSALDVAASVLTSTQVAPAAPSFIIGVSDDGSALALVLTPAEARRDGRLEPGVHRLVLLTLDSVKQEVGSSNIADVYVDAESHPTVQFDAAGTRAFLVGVRLAGRQRSGTATALRAGRLALTFDANPFELDQDPGVPASLNSVSGEFDQERDVLFVAASRDGVHAAVAYKGIPGVQLFELREGVWTRNELLRTPIGDLAKHLGFSPSGTYLVGVSELGSAFIWNLGVRPSKLVTLRSGREKVEFAVLISEERDVLLATRGQLTVRPLARDLDAGQRYMEAERALFEAMRQSRIPDCPSAWDFTTWGLLPTGIMSARAREQPKPSVPVLGKHLCGLIRTR